jgi:RsiW-degrading membrane proteinase PrsW (M82 family)
MNDAKLIDAIEAYWVERTGVFWTAVMGSALWAGVAVVLAVLWHLTGEPMTGLWIVWAVVQAGIAISAWIRMASIDRRAEDAVEQSEAFQRLVRQLERR